MHWIRSTHIRSFSGLHFPPIQAEYGDLLCKFFMILLWYFHIYLWMTRSLQFSFFHIVSKFFKYLFRLPFCLRFIKCISFNWIKNTLKLKKKKNIMALFHEWSSTVSRLQSHYVETVYFRQFVFTLLQFFIPSKA